MGVDGLRTAHPLVEQLPALYQEDDFTGRFLEGLDEVLAPLLTVLDCLPAYLDPRLSPLDLLAWVGSWSGVAVDPAWPVERQRAVVLAAVRLLGQRGTRAALEEWVELVLGLRAEVTESGGAIVSDVPDADLPGSADAVVRVRLRGASAAQLAEAEPVLRAWCPAHVRLEVRALR